MSLAVALAVVAVAVPAASARVRDGQLQWTHAENCFSTIYYPPVVYAAQTGGDAGVVEPDDGSVISGDHPFYVRAIFAGIDSDCVGVGGIVSLEFIPPVGVSVVNDPAYPPYWTSIPPDGGQAVRQSAPVVLSPGPDPGGVLAELSPSSGGPVWQYENGGPEVAVYIPLRTTRRLDGILGPGCPQLQANSDLVGFAGDISYDDYLTLQETPAPAPCPPDLAGDYLQVVMDVADTGYPTQIVPYVGLFATQPTSSNSGGSGPSKPARHRGGSARKLAVHAPRSLSVSRARHGTKCTVTNVPRGKLATVTLTLGTRVVAQAAGRARRNGTVTVILTPNRGGAARLHAGVQLWLTVTVGGTHVARPIRLRTG
jgi:hypothetical protein